MAADPRPVLLIDLSALYHAAFHVVPETDPINKVHDIVLSSVRHCKDATRGALVAICCDGKGNWRKALSPEYKATREQKPRSFFEMFDRLKDRLRADGELVWECDGFEADDVIATACDAAIAAGHPVTIATHDKDLCQLSADGVTILNTQKWITLDRAQVVEKFGVQPHQIGDLLALIGDKSDNVKGAQGVGQIKGVELLKRYETVDKLYAAVNDAPRVATDPFWRTSDGKKPLALHAALVAAEADVRLAKKLVALRYDAPLKFENIYDKREITPLTNTTDAEFEDAKDMISQGPGPVATSPQNGTVAQPTGDSEAKATTTGPTAAGESKGPGAVGATREGSPAAPAVQGQTALTAPKNDNSAALAEFNADMQPTGMRGLWWLASRASVAGLYPDFRSPEAALMIMARGKDFGLSPSAALELLRPVKGHISVPANLLIERAKQHPDCEYFYFKNKSATSVTCVARNRRDPEGVVTENTYTIAMAKAAGLYRAGSAWESHPERMCLKMAGAFTARELFPSTTLGAYAYEEMENAA